MFDFSKQEYEELIDELMLNEEMQKILEMKIKGCSIIEISMKLNISERTVNRRVKLLKKKILHIL